MVSNGRKCANELAEVDCDKIKQVLTKTSRCETHLDKVFIEVSQSFPLFQFIDADVKHVMLTKTANLERVAKRDVRHAVFTWPHKIATLDGVEGALFEIGRQQKKR